MRIVLAATLCAVALGASAQMYRWTDEKGRVHVTDMPPPASAKGVIKSGAVPAEPAPTRSSGQEPFALQQARANYPITLYTAPDCEGCDAARKLLNARGLPFKEVNVIDATQIEELQKAVGSNSVPAIIVGSTVQKGFEEGAYQRLLDAAGYPKTGALSPRSQAAPKPPAPALPEVKPAPQPERPTGPYAPGAAAQEPKKK
ncbi:MAG: glutaredoxin family protein [Betaproteobacteria bacterium]|nr:glutaredoxin family protein [Betaproteobacteria bacterium]